MLGSRLRGQARCIEYNALSGPDNRAIQPWWKAIWCIRLISQK